MVRSDDDGERRIDAREARQRGEQEFPPGEIEAGSGLVQEQQPRLRHQSPDDQDALALAMRAVAEAALGQATEAERAEQHVGAVDIERREPFLEVADRARRACPRHLPHGQHRRKAITVACIDEADLLA